MEGSVLHRISSSVFRTGRKPALSPRTRSAHPTAGHAFQSATKAFAMAGGAQAAISLCFRLISVRSLQKLKAAFSTSALRDIAKVSARFGTFIGLMNFAVQFMEYLYFKVNGSLWERRHSPDVAKILRWRSKVKNVLTALLCAAALMIENKSRRHNIALFLFPRAIDTISCVGIKKGYIPYFAHAPTILFTVSGVRNRLLVPAVVPSSPVFSPPGVVLLLFCGTYL